MNDGLNRRIGQGPVAKLARTPIDLKPVSAVKLSLAGTSAEAQSVYYIVCDLWAAGNAPTIEAVCEKTPVAQNPGGPLDELVLCGAVGIANLGQNQDDRAVLFPFAIEEAEGA